MARHLFALLAVGLSVLVGCSSPVTPATTSSLPTVIVSRLGPDPPGGYILEARDIAGIRGMACKKEGAPATVCWPDAQPSAQLVLLAFGGFTPCLHLDRVHAVRGPSSVTLHIYRRRGSCLTNSPDRPMALIGIRRDDLPPYARADLPRAIDSVEPPIVPDYIDD